MCSSIFLENSKLYFPFSFTDCFNGVVSMILGTTCLKGHMNQKIEIFCFVTLPSPNTKKKHPK